MNTKVKWSNVVLLFVSQAFFQTSSILTMTLSGVIGLSLATDKNLATLPLSMISTGAAAIMIPASLIIKKLGLRKAFMMGAGIGVVSGLVSLLGILQQSFWLFTAGNMLLGTYQGFAQYQRFAAADDVPDKAKSKAVAVVISAGVIAAIAGPNLAKITQHLGTVPYAYSYFSIILLSLMALGVVSFLRLKHRAAPQGLQGQRRARPLLVIAKKKDTVLAVLASATAFAVMGMAMTAAPIAMHHLGHPTDHAANVIQWHVLGMYLPSFFTGMLIQKFGVYRVLLAGVAILLLYLGIAFSGTSFTHFFTGMFVVGLGWNFLFIGGTSLLATVYLPEEKEKTQAYHDFTVYAFIGLSSFFAGRVLNFWGWQGVNYVLLLLLLFAVLIAITLRWYAYRKAKTNLAKQ